MLEVLLTKDDFDKGLSDRRIVKLPGLVGYSPEFFENSGVKFEKSSWSVLMNVTKKENSQACPLSLLLARNGKVEIN